MCATPVSCSRSSAGGSTTSSTSPRFSRSRTCTRSIAKSSPTDAPHIARRLLGLYDPEALEGVFNTVLPVHRALTDQLLTPGVVGDEGVEADSALDEAWRNASKFRDVIAHLPVRHGIISSPIHDCRRDGRDLEEQMRLSADVLPSDRRTHVAIADRGKPRSAFL